MNQALVFLTDKSDSHTLKIFDEFKKECYKFGDVVLAFHQKEKFVPVEIEKRGAFVFSDLILRSLNYKPLCNTLVPGSTHFPIFKFFLENRGYDFYWCIEDDVRFLPGWADFFYFFENNKKSDFLTCDIKPFAEESIWFWWSRMYYKDLNIVNAVKMRSFNPIIRLSSAAMETLHQDFLEGWYGHHEVLLPTLLSQHGLKINDFGGNNEYVLAGCRNKFYDDDTMRYRPCIEKGEINKPLLYHPVKFLNTTNNHE